MNPRKESTMNSHLSGFRIGPCQSFGKHVELWWERPPSSQRPRIVSASQEDVYMAEAVNAQGETGNLIYCDRSDVCVESSPPDGVYVLQGSTYSFIWITPVRVVPPELEDIIGIPESVCAVGEPQP